MCWPCCQDLFVYGSYIDDFSGLPDFEGAEWWNLNSGAEKGPANAGSVANSSNDQIAIYAYGPDGSYYVTQLGDFNYHKRLVRISKSGALSLEYTVESINESRDVLPSYRDDSDRQGGSRIGQEVIVHTDGSITVFGMNRLSIDTAPNPDQVTEVHPRERKYDIDGNVLWERWWNPLTYDQDSVLSGLFSKNYFSPVLNADDSIWVASGRSDPMPERPESGPIPTISRNPVFARIDPDDGTEQFSFTSDISENGPFGGYPVAAWADGSFVAASRNPTGAFDSSAELKIVKYDSSGSELWDYTFTGTAAGSARRLGWVDPSGNLLFVNGNQLTKFDSSGSVVWQSTIWQPDEIGTTGTPGSVMTMDRRGNVYLGGKIVDGATAPPGTEPPVVKRFDTDGSEKWAEQWTLFRGSMTHLYARKGTYPLG